MVPWYKSGEISKYVKEKEKAKWKIWSNPIPLSFQRGELKCRFSRDKKNPYIGNVILTSGFIEQTKTKFMSLEQGTENGLAPTTCKENGLESKGFLQIMPTLSSYKQVYSLKERFTFL